MPRFEPDNYQSVERYEEALAALHFAVVAVLFELARDGEGNRDTIIRNFIARSEMTATSIFQLYRISDYQSCWVLHRCLVDRLFHLHSLQKDNAFDDFEEWSFLKQYNAMNRMRSDPEVSGVRGHPLFTITREQKSRASELSKKDMLWYRPKPELVAKEMDMQFLYRYGYDFASTHVHPMANDGDQDFYSISGLQAAKPYPDQRMVLSNTLLVATMVVQEGLNASTPQWRALVYQVLEGLRLFVGTGSMGYKDELLTLTAEVARGTRMSQKTTSNQTTGSASSTEDA